MHKFTYFPGEIIFHKRRVSREFRANRPKISANRQFTENFLARILEKISAFYTVCCVCNIQWTCFFRTGVGCGSSILRTDFWERTSNVKSLKFILQVPFSRPRIIFLVVDRTPTHSLCPFFRMFIIFNVYFQKMTFERLHLSTTFKDKTLFTRFS